VNFYERRIVVVVGDGVGMSEFPILVVNSGSSSLKLGLLREAEGDEAILLDGEVGGIGRQDGELTFQDAEGKEVFREEGRWSSQTEALRRGLEVIGTLKAGRPVGVGHRVVHGGPKLREHQRITAEVKKTLREAVHFAPLHIPAALDLIEAVEKVYPELPQFACFDTAFHRTMPEEAWHYALPVELKDEGVQRYGFHGLSYESIVQQVKDDVPKRMVVAHLGNGCSVAAIAEGRSVDTSMGMTPTGGVVMGTRSGDLDPGVALYLIRAKGMGADEMETILNHKSGLAGLAGGHGDMRDIEEAAGKGDAAAVLALEVFDRTVAKTVAGYASVLGGLDALVFTGGIGEHSDRMRKSVCGRLGFLGLERDGVVRVLPSEEDLQIARHCRRLMGA
jgi:acetate kinase